MSDSIVWWSHCKLVHPLFTRCSVCGQPMVVTGSNTFTFPLYEERKQTTLEAGKDDIEENL